MAVQDGFRKSEWAQDSGLLKSTKDVAKNVDGSAKAFLLSDFTFKGAKGGPITRLSPSSLTRAAMVDITWRFQKTMIMVKPLHMPKTHNLLMIVLWQLPLQLSDEPCA